MNNFQQKGEEKILVISILGPQSTGKSTMLNKMFGCHFWTGVGRCTKGIYLQKVKVHNKELYNNLFDQILLLDTEGLQNPNQSDPDFDKQIALFMLLVSDIVIINIKGEITKQFRELIEMCIFTLGQLHKNFNFVKQLSWCFNQNTHTNNKDPFIEQIQSCTDNLNKESNKEDNDEQKGHYEDILEINKDNVTVLGFSAQAKNWKYNKLDQLFQDCKQLIFNENFSTETQIYGQNIVTNFVKKFNKQKDFTQLQTFSNFIQHIEENWESIQKLPDLLEFSDLISYQQNNLMKKKFDSLMLQVDLGFIKNIETNIIQLIKNQKQKLTNQTFNNIQKQEEENQNKQLQKIKENVLGDLQEYKQQKQIAKKIYQKYIQQLEQFIKVKESDCKTQIFNIVKKQEREHSKQQGIDQINQFVISLYQNEDELKLYQKNPQLVLEVFEQMWNQIQMAQTVYTIKLFDEFSINKFDQIQQSFPHCILQTQSQQNYLNFLQELNKINPQDQSGEREQIFNLFLKELEAKQFINLDKNHSNYYDQFYIDIQQKLKKKFSTQLIQIQDFYKWKVVWKHFNKDILENYLKTTFVQDLKLIIIDCQNQSTDKKFCDFMIFLNQFQVNYDQTHFQELVFLVKKKNEKNLDQALQKLKNSFNFNSKLCLIITNREFQYQIPNFYPSLYQQLETTAIEVNSFESVEVQKQTLLAKAVIYNEEINIQPSYEKEAIFYYLKNPKNQKEYVNFIPKIPQIINDLVEKYQGWQKIYYGLYDMIKSEVFNKNIPIAEEDDEIFIFKNNSLISLVNLIQKKVEEYNSQLSIYGVIFSNIGERCIYYFCILLIWRFGCYQKWQILEKHTLELKNDRGEQLKKLQAEIQKDKINQSKHKATKIIQLFKKYQQNKILQSCKSIADQIILEKRKTSKDLIRFLDQNILMQNFEKEQNDSQRKNIIFYIFNQKSFILEYVEKEIQQIRDQIMLNIEENLKQFNSYYQEQIKNLEGNTNLFLKKIEGEEQYIKNYFTDILQQKEDLFFEQQLYSQVILCLFYAEQINKDQIKFEYREAFSEKFIPIDFNKNELEKLQTSDKEIQQLKCFLNMLIQELCQIKEEINQFKIDLNTLGVMVKKMSQNLK